MCVTVIFLYRSTLNDNSPIVQIEISGMAMCIALSMGMPMP